MAVCAEQHTLGGLGSYLANTAGETLVAEVELLGRGIEMMEFKGTGMSREAADHAGSTGLLDQLTLYLSASF